MIPRAERIWAGFVTGALLVLLVTAAFLRPAAEGHGTHEQLGLPPCGFYISTGAPCPTCGMTTAFAHMAHAHPVKAAITQPFGAILALSAAVAFWGALHVAAFGSRLGRVAGKLLGSKAVYTTAAVWLASWLYTIAAWRV